MYPCPWFGLFEPSIREFPYYYYYPKTGVTQTSDRLYTRASETSLDAKYEVKDLKLLLGCLCLEDLRNLGPIPHKNTLITLKNGITRPADGL